MGHDALLLLQIARDLLHALSHTQDNTWHGLWRTSRQHWRHVVEQVVYIQNGIHVIYHYVMNEKRPLKIYMVIYPLYICRICP